MSFHLFSEFPNEIKELIWDQAAEGPFAYYLSLTFYPETFTLRSQSLRYTVDPSTAPQEFGKASRTPWGRSRRLAVSTTTETAQLPPHAGDGEEISPNPLWGLLLACRASYNAVRRYHNALRRHRKRLKYGKWLDIDTSQDEEVDTDKERDLLILSTDWAKDLWGWQTGLGADTAHRMPGYESTWGEVIGIPWVSLFPTSENFLVPSVTRPSMIKTAVMEKMAAVLLYIMTKVPGLLRLRKMYLIVDGEVDASYSQVRFYAPGREYFEVDMAAENLGSIRAFLDKARECWHAELEARRNDAYPLRLEEKQLDVPFGVLSWKFV